MNDGAVCNMWLPKSVRKTTTIQHRRCNRHLSFFANQSTTVIWEMSMSGLRRCEDFFSAFCWRKSRFLCLLKHEKMIFTIESYRWLDFIEIRDIKSISHKHDSEQFAAATWQFQQFVNCLLDCICLRLEDSQLWCIFQTSASQTWTEINDFLLRFLVRCEKFTPKNFQQQQKWKKKSFYTACNAQALQWLRSFSSEWI